ncbi:MAG: DUF4293 family protein [Saprospiraceae bacterium]|uniref:DUF4293 family protein n=1 Tax=Candidatus Defluviibacterium haderslevense TaxID=2981993 RepID=A0A9D7S868_9BACT|nr:DUF4293 family protein [Candidatus Defluviibacterium haderslevense]MBK9716691.1 DUF4293 family protein [Candidatus Defluviibacterium haderslevense]MBL0235923.1 DUF4293 family protein [Candidatus Defluviibacterium haderslevense]
MIQRKQSLWLLLSSLCCGFELYPSFIMVKTITPGIGMLEDNIIQATENPIIMYGSILSAGLAFSAIFLFKNRGLQILIASLAAMIQLFACIGFVFYTLYSNGKFPEMRAEIGLYLGIFGVISVWLATRGIRRDEEIVQSQDRLR